MESKKVTRYYCEYCNPKKGFWKKQDCLNHEKKCYFNKNNKQCGSCIHFNKYHCLEFDMTLCSEHNYKEQLKESKHNVNHFKVFPKICGTWSFE